MFQRVHESAVISVHIDGSPEGWCKITGRATVCKFSAYARGSCISVASIQNTKAHQGNRIIKTHIYCILLIAVGTAIRRFTQRLQSDRTLLEKVSLVQKELEPR